MLELGRKEQHLMGGLGFQLLIILLLVFAYTQAVRQVKLAKELSGRLREQLTVAREEVARQGGRPDVSVLKARVAELKSALISREGLPLQAKRLERMAQERFGIRNARVSSAGQPVEKLSVPLEGQPDLEIQLCPLEMKGTAGSREISGLLDEVSDPAFKPLCPLVAMELKTTEPAGIQPVEFVLRWVMAVSADSSSGSSEPAPSASAQPLPWGWREEPFLSPFVHPNALRIPAEKLGLFRLSGIVQEGKTGPTCLINGELLKPGDRVKGYQVVLIVRNTVLLEGKEEELLLSLP